MTGRFVLAAVACLALAAPAPRAQAPAAFSIEQVLSAPTAAELVAAPVGQRLAWVFNEQGSRNIWVAEGPAFTGRKLTPYAGDNGQAITSLTWTPDGETLVYVRGGGPNGAGEIPNPTSDPAGIEQAVWAVPFDAGEPRQIGAGDQPVVSPKGDLVAFVQRGQVWVGGVSGTPAAEQAFKARGNARSLRWSPDGGALAFTSARGTHAFIGVYDFSEESLRYLDPSVDTDGDPVWSPDGGSVAFIRRPATRDQIPFHPEREGEPWSIRVAELASGTGREIWKSTEGPGSVFQGITGDNLIWLASGQLVFPWERDGWKHLYSVRVDGNSGSQGTGEAVLLTPGDFEVEDVVLVPDGRSIVFNSNQGDIDRRHIWTTAGADGMSAAPPVAITTGDAIEWSPAVLADGRHAFLRSDAHRPGRPVVQVGEQEHEVASAALPPDFPASALVEPEAVTVIAADGMPIHAQLFKPAGGAEGERHPAVIFFHGGSRRQMLLGWHYLDYYNNAYGLNQYLASRGYVVLAVNYRSGIGYGLEFREAIDYGAAGASEYNDVVGAGLYLRGRSDVDPARIGLWGGSYGGYLTAMGLSRASDLFAAGVDLHGVHDWNVVIRNFQPGFNPEAQQEIARRAFLASPMSSIDGWRSPVLVVHGDDDRNVPFSETVDLVEQLRKRDVHVEQLIFPDEVHGFLLHERWVRTFKAAADFFDRYLGAKAGPTQ